jgi:hypothetical protein
MKFGFGDILQQAQKMKDELQRIQESAAKKTIEVSSGGGMVRVVANGKQEILSITIEDQILRKNDREMIQDVVRAGVNEAIKSSQQMMAEEMGKLTGALGPLAELFTKANG